MAKKGVGVRADEVEEAAHHQGAGRDREHDAERADPGGGEDHRAEEAGEDRGLTHRAGEEADEGVPGGEPGSAGRVEGLRQRLRSGEAEAGEPGGAADRVRRGVGGDPDAVSGEVARVGEEEEGAGGERRVEDVEAAAAEDLLADDHAEGDAERHLPERHGGGAG